MKKTLILILFAGLLIYGGCKKSSKDAEPVLTDATIDIQILTQNLSFPWEITWGPDNMIWMTERNGKISRVKLLAIRYGV